MIFKNYEYFLTIAEEGNISSAARKLFVSQPSLSQYLKRLETNLGVELFDHTRYPLQLTYAGERYLAYVQDLFNLDRRMQQEFSDITQNRRGKIRLGIAYWRGSYVLPQVLPEFLQMWPNIDIDVTEECGNLVIKDLSAEKLDFAVMNITSTMDLSNLVCRELFPERILLAVKKGTGLSRQLKESAHVADGILYPVIDPELLRNCSFILPKAGMNFCITTTQFLNKYQIKPKTLLNLENTSTALHLVAEGLGICFVPEGGAIQGYFPENLDLFAFEDPEMRWNLSLVYRKDAVLNPAILDFEKIALKKLNRTEY